MEHQPTVDSPQTGWPREELLSRARLFLRKGGQAARRELVLTSIALDRLLREGR